MSTYFAVSTPVVFVFVFIFFFMSIFSNRLLAFVRGGCCWWLGLAAEFFFLVFVAVSFVVKRVCEPLTVH